MKFLKYSAFAIATVSVFAGCASASAPASAPTAPSTASASAVAPASSAVAAVTKVKVAHTQTYVPYDFVNEKGESDGFEVKVLMAVDELLPQYEFEYVPTTDDDLLIGVETGK